MITTIVLARKLLNQISNYSDNSSLGRHPIFDMFKDRSDGLAPLFGDWDLLRVLPPSQLSQRNDYLNEINEYCLDKRVVFGWKPHPDKPDEAEWQFKYTNKALFAYLEIQISPWLIRHAGVNGLYWVVELIQKQLNCLGENAHHILCGLGQADVLVFMFGDTYDELLKQCLHIRAMTMGDLRRDLEKATETPPFMSSASYPEHNHVIIETYTLFGYLPHPQHGLDFNNLDQSLAHIDDSPTTKLYPTIFVSCHPGHELSVIETLKNKIDIEDFTSMVTHSLLMPGIFDIKIDWSVDENGSVGQKRLLSEVLTIVKNLCEKQSDVNGTNIVWMCEDKPFLNLKKSEPHSFHDNASFIIRPIEPSIIKKIREKAGTEFADILQELIASYNVASSHFWTRTYIHDFGQMLEKFANWLRETKYFDNDRVNFNSLAYLERFAKRLILVLLARKTVGVHALRSEPLYHPSLAIQKISTALNTAGHRLLEYFDALEEQATYLFTISPVGLVSNITLHLDEHKKFVLHEASPTVFFGDSFFEAMHDICLLLRAKIFSAELEHTVLTAVAIWLEAEFTPIFEQTYNNCVLPILQESVQERLAMLKEKAVHADERKATKEILDALSSCEFIYTIARDIGVPEDLLRKPENIIKLSSVAALAAEKVKETRMLFEKNYADLFVAEIVGSASYMQYLQRAIERRYNGLMKDRLYVLQCFYQKESFPNHPEILVVLSFLKKHVRPFIDQTKTKKGENILHHLKKLCHSAEHGETLSPQNLDGFLYWWQESFQLS